MKEAKGKGECSTPAASFLSERGGKKKRRRVVHDRALLHDSAGVEEGKGETSGRGGEIDSRPATSLSFSHFPMCHMRWKKKKKNRKERRKKRCGGQSSSKSLYSLLIKRRSGKTAERKKYVFIFSPLQLQEERERNRKERKKRKSARIYFSSTPSRGKEGGALRGKK